MLWCSITSQLKWSIDDDSITMESLIFLPDDASLVSGCINGTIRFWNIANGNLQHTIKSKHRALSPLLAFSPDGQLPVFHGSGVLNFWNVATGDIQMIIDGVWSSITAMDFSPDGRLLASVCVEGSIKLWNTITAKLLQKIHYDNVTILRFHSDHSTNHLSLVTERGFIIINYRRTDKLSRRDYLENDIQEDVISSEKDVVPSEEDVTSSEEDVTSSEEDVTSSEEDVTPNEEGVIWLPSRYQPQQSQAHICSSSCREGFVCVDHDWITWNDEPVLLLPLYYGQAAVDFKNKVIALAHRSDKPTFLEIDLRIAHEQKRVLSTGELEVSSDREDKRICRR